jgi:isopropylmalate/homocitrate/citramalate synthase
MLSRSRTATALPVPASPTVSACTPDAEWIAAVADQLKHAVLTTLLLPGIGTVHDLREAKELGVRSVRVATHCTEADIAIQHIDFARNIGMDVAGFLMMSHMSGPQELLVQARIMEKAGGSLCLHHGFGRSPDHGCNAGSAFVPCAMA